MPCTCWVSAKTILSAKNWTKVLILFQDKVIVKRCLQCTRIKLGVLTCLLSYSYRQLKLKKQRKEYQIKLISLPRGKIKCLRDHHASCVRVCVRACVCETEREVYMCVSACPSIKNFKTFVTPRFSINPLWMSLYLCSCNFPKISSNNMVKPRKCKVGKMVNLTGYLTTLTGLRKSCCCYRYFVILF